MTTRKARLRVVGVAFLLAMGLVPPHGVETLMMTSPESEEAPNQVLEWNQIFIDTLIVTNTANSSSQRLGAIVQTAVFDAYNGIVRRYTPIFVQPAAPPGASRRAAVIAAAHTALVGLFPARQAALDASYTASLAALSDDGGDGGQSRVRGIAWGVHVAESVLAWRANDGFGGTYPAFIGGTAIGQWRPTPPAFGPMSAQPLAFTDMFVRGRQHSVPASTATRTRHQHLHGRFQRRQGARPQARDRRARDDQSLLAVFWEGNASVHWNQAANQLARANHLSMSESNRLLAMLNIAMADTAFTTWSGKRFYGANPTEVTWRPVTAIPLADSDGNPDTVADPTWVPLINTPSHPEYPAGHPSLNGAAATVLLSHFDDAQTFTLTTGQTSRTYDSITQARTDGNNGRVWGGMHFPSTVAISDAEGEAIATYVHQNAMKRARPRR